MLKAKRLGKRLAVLISSLCFLNIVTLNNAKAEIIELALLLDGSGSISSSDFALQTGAYKSVFQDNFFSSNLNTGDSLWVSAYQFSSDVSLEISAMEITDDASAFAFGALFDSIMQDPGLTNTGEAVNVASNDLLNDQVVGERLIIDVSTDGFPSTGPNAVDAAAAAFASGITVNAIGVGSGINSAFLSEFTTAGGGFFLTAASFDEFESALRDKIQQEIIGPGPGPGPSPVPEPSALALMLVGLSLFKFKRRR